MARRRTALWRALPAFLKFALLGLSLMLSIVLTHGQVGQAQVSQQYLAQQLTQHGHAQLNQGQAAAALKTWQAATKNYRQLRNPEGVTGSLINESLALQALGLNIRACDTLTLALKLENWVCQNPNGTQPLTSVQSQQRLDTSLQKQIYSPVTVIGLRNLGDVLRLLGKPNESEITLQKALAMTSTLALDANNGDLLLSLGNTERTLYNQAKNRYQLTDEPIVKETALKTAQAKAKIALELYQQIDSFSQAKQNGIALQAQLNYLSLFLELGESTKTNAQGDASTFKSLQPTDKRLLQPLLAQLLTEGFTQLPPIQSIYARLNLASSLIQIAQNKNLFGDEFLKNVSPLEIALQQAETAKQVSQKLNNQRAKSYALGMIGKIHINLNYTNRARQYLEKALAYAQSVQAWDIAYQWQQQLGQLYKLSGNLNQATKAYAAAVSSLDQVRGNILSVNVDIQFSFKEKVEPVYQDYLRLLLAAPTPNLKQVIQTNELLQLAELENFLQCGKLDLVSLNNTQSPRPGAIIHIINLDSRIEVILQSSNGSLYHHTPEVNSVQSNLTNLLVNFQDPRFIYTDESVVIPYSQKLYNLLIAPIKTYLPKSGTIVFALDSSFQSLPVVLLHDGQKYLIEQYSVALTLGAQLRQPQALKQSQMKALIAGISEKSPSFQDPNAPVNLTPLPEVKTEVADVKANTVSSIELLNEAFTRERLEQQIDTANYPIVHITTHGQFSSDPEQTVILAWDRTINTRELDSLLKSQSQNPQLSLELLVLSACQTAKGDRRSGLGIAGVAAQAGARTTVASLWLVEADSTAELMGKFYQGLKNGLTKAEALRQAQLTLLSSRKYHHPYYWSPFVLVGSWL